MKFLNLHGNKIEDDGFYKMSTCVSKIKELWIGSRSDKYLTAQGIRALSLAVADSTIKVE